MTHQVPDTMGRTWMWKLVSKVAGITAAYLVQKLIKAAYQAVRTDTAPSTPFDSKSPQFSWSKAILWTIAGGIGLGIARVVSARLATVGWEAATGTLPPGVIEESAAV